MSLISLLRDKIRAVTHNVDEAIVEVTVVDPANPSNHLIPGASGGLPSEVSQDTHDNLNANITLQISDVDAPGGSGVTTSSTPRVVHSSNDPAVLSLSSIDSKIPADPAREGGNLASVLGRLDITLSSLRDAIRGSSTKDFSTLEADIEALEAIANAIRTSVETLDNIVSGSEAQVDIISSALPSGAASNSKLDEIKTLIGEVQASPTDNTILDRLKDLLTGIVLAASSNVIGKIGIDQTIPGTTDRITANLDKVNGTLQTARDWSSDFAKLDIALSALRDALKGASDKDFSTLETDVEAISGKLPANLGQKASSDSLALVLSTEQETILNAVKTAVEIIDNIISVAHDSPDAVNPVKIGLKYTASPTTVDNGDIVNALSDQYGRIRVLQDTALDPANDSITIVGNDGDDGTGTRRVIKTNSAGETQVDLRNSYAHVTADTQIKSSAGRIHTIIINKVTGNGDITIYDSTAESGTVVAVIGVDTAKDYPKTLTYDVECATGIYIGYDGSVAADLTISYK